MKTAPTICLFDIPRTSEKFMNYGTLEQIKNGLFFSGKYESRMFMMDNVHEFVFANFAPPKGVVSDDRWVTTDLNSYESKVARGLYERARFNPVKQNLEHHEEDVD